MKNRTQCFLLLVLCFSIHGGCGTDYTAAVVLQLNGAVAPVGGAYDVEVRRSDAAPLDKLPPQQVEVVPGEAKLTVLLEDARLYTGNVASVWLRVRSRSGLGADASAIGLGSVALTVDKGQVVEATIQLENDPRPLSGVVMAAIASADQQRDGRHIHVATQAVDTAGGVLVAWADDGEQIFRLGELTESSSSLVAEAPGAERLISRAALRVLVTLEDLEHVSELGHPLGWEIFSGEIDGAIISQLRALLNQDGSLARLFALLEHARVHAGFAADGAFSDIVHEVRVHSEHVYNILIDEAEQQGFINPGSPDLPHGIDPAGAHFYRQEAAQIASSAAETLPSVSLSDPAAAPFPTRAAINAAAQACAANLSQIIDSALAEAEQNATGHGDGIDQGLVQQLLDLTNDLFGAPFGAEGVQTGECFYNRIETLSAFVMPPLPAGAL